MEKVLTYNTVQNNIHKDIKSYHFKINAINDLHNDNIKILKKNLNIAIILLFLDAWVNYFINVEFLLIPILIYFFLILAWFIFFTIIFIINKLDLMNENIKDLEIKTILNNKNYQEEFINQFIR